MRLGRIRVDAGSLVDPEEDFGVTDPVGESVSSNLLRGCIQKWLLVKISFQLDSLICIILGSSLLPPSSVPLFF
jgi:hypothetical protein